MLKIRCEKHIVYLTSYCCFSGQDVIQALKAEYIDEYLDFVREFETKKRLIDPEKNEKTFFRLPPSILKLTESKTGIGLADCVKNSKYSSRVDYLKRQCKLRVDTSVLVELFQKPVMNIVEHVKKLMSDELLKDCKAVVLVGGFSESPVLQNAVKQNLKNVKVVIPHEAGLAVLKGAAIFGFCPRVITERVCKYTYGIETSHVYSTECNHPVTRQITDSNDILRCIGIFHTHARYGQSVKFGQEQSNKSYFPFDDQKSELGIPIYRSKNSDPVLVTDPGCEQIGYLNVPVPEHETYYNRSVKCCFLFGGTEIIVKVRVDATGETFEKRIDFLA